MNCKEWLKLVEEKKEEILKKGEEAYAEAINNQHLRFIVEMDDDGTVYDWYDVAGGNSFHASTHEGKSIEILHFCFQNEEFEINEDDILNKLTEKGFEKRIPELMEEAEEECTTLEINLINNHSNDELSDIIKECVQDVINFNISEYAREESETQMEQLKSNLEDMYEDEKMEVAYNESLNYIL